VKIITKYDIGQILYLVTDLNQFEWMCTGIVIYPNNLIAYSLSCGAETCEAYEFEVSDQQDIIKRTSN